MTKDQKILFDYFDIILQFRNRSNTKLCYCSIEHLIKENGKFMPKRKFNSKLYPKAFRDERLCYRNAFHLVENSNLTYVEGFVVALGIPVLHAWCIDIRGNVVDPTISHEKTKVYFGVPFKTEYVMETVYSRKIYGVIENIEQRMPLLTGEVKIEDVIVK